MGYPRPGFAPGARSILLSTLTHPLSEDLCMGNDAKVHLNTTFKRFLCYPCSTSIPEHTGPGGANTEHSNSPPSSCVGDHLLDRRGSYERALGALRLQTSPSMSLTGAAATR